MQTLTGNPATVRASPLAVSAVADGDPANAANLATSPLQPILDVIALLQAQGARLDLGNTFTQAQVVQGLLTLSAAGAAALTRSGDQTILKSGSGKLQVGTSIAGALELVVNGVVRAAFDSSTGLETTMQFTAPTVTRPTLNASYWAATNDGPGYWVDRAGVLHLMGTATSVNGSANAIFTLPSGLRPLNTRYFAIVSTNGGSPVFRDVFIGSSGAVMIDGAPTTGWYYSLDAITLLPGV